jgi:hypothetical protein
MTSIPLAEAAAMASTHAASYLGIEPRGQVEITTASRDEDWRFRFVQPKE